MWFRGKRIAPLALLEEVLFYFSALFPSALATAFPVGKNTFIP